MTKQILKNIPFALLDAVTPSNAQSSLVYALPATASFIEVVAALSATVATETVTCSIYGAEAVGGPFVLISSALVPANATNIAQSFGAFCAFTHIKVVLSSVTIVSSTLTVTVNAKDTVGSLSSGGTFNGNIIPTIDQGYTLGDATHRWSEVDTNKVNLSLDAGPATALYAYDDGSFELDVPTSNTYLYFDAASGDIDIGPGGGADIDLYGSVSSKTWSLRDAIIVDGQNTSQSIVYGKTRLTDRGYHPNPFAGSRFLGEYQVTTQVGSFAAIAGFYSSYEATDGTPPSDGIVGLISRVSYGTGGIAAKGDCNALSGDIIVAGSGSASNEYAAANGAVRMDIGTGYTQAVGPTGRIWGLDYGVMGPIAVQPRLLDGGSIVVNNYYNGSPADTPSGGLWLVTSKAAGPGNDGTHGAANSYPIDVGLGIIGVSNDGSDKIGFTTGIRIGGAGSGWSVAASKIATGIVIQDYTTRGLYINTPSGSPTASIDADGLIKGGSFAVGSSAGVDASITTAGLVGKTITVSKGIITGFA